MIYNSNTFNNEYDADKAAHINELRFKIDCMYRLLGELHGRSGGEKRAERLLDDIGIYEAALLDLEGGMNSISLA